MIGRYIIFADDDDDDLELITSYFKEFEPAITILPFRNGKDVIKFLDSSSSKGEPLPVLVVMDINMPRLDGMTTLATIRENDTYKDVSVVIYTTSMNKNNMQVCKDMDATWLIKPSSVQQIRETARILAEFCNLQKS